MSKKEKFQTGCTNQVKFYKLDYNGNTGKVELKNSELPWIPLECDCITSIIYMNCNGILTPYLGPNGKPCRWNGKDEVIEEIL